MVGITTLGWNSVWRTCDIYFYYKDKHRGVYMLELLKLDYTIYNCYHLTRD